MRINVENLQEVIKKSTLNYMIPSVQLKIDRDKITTKMRSANNTVVIYLDVDNNVFSDIPDSIELNFDEPNVKVKPYLNLIDSEFVNAEFTDDKLTLKDGRHKTNLHFCMSSFVTTFTGQGSNIPTFYDLRLTPEIGEIFDKIQKVAGKFEVVYFTIKDKRFIIETTDKTNRFSNGISFDLGEIDHGDISICFEFRNFKAVLQCMEGVLDEFVAKFTWVEEQEAGMVLFEKNDGSEKYSLLSKIED